MKVLAALSGGVDSSVAAAVLVEQGHEVVGATLKLWGGASDSGCCSVADVEDARRSASQLGIDHHVFDYTEEFGRRVVAPYVEDHLGGRTPNPCIECNRHLKFDALTRRAEVLGFDAVATGHHARRVAGPDGNWRLARGRDAAKDQSYVLHPLRSPDLERLLFPVGELTKREVRSIAAGLGLRTADKPESQDVCFVTRAEGREAFLRARAELHPATVVDAEGEVVGSTDAVELVTLGQRKGLNLAGGSSRRFVTAVDVRARRVTVGPADDLLAPEVLVAAPTWSAGPPAGLWEPDGVEVVAQCSAHGSAEAATVRLLADGPDVGVEWHTPQPRVAPGQSVVFYRDGDTDAVGQDIVLGGGPAFLA